MLSPNCCIETRPWLFSQYGKPESVTRRVPRRRKRPLWMYTDHRLWRSAACAEKEPPIGIQPCLHQRFPALRMKFFTLFMHTHTHTHHCSHSTTHTSAHTHTHTQTHHYTHTHTPLHTRQYTHTTTLLT